MAREEILYQKNILLKLIPESIFIFEDYFISVHKINRTLNIRDLGVTLDSKLLIKR